MATDRSSNERKVVQPSLDDMISEFEITHILEKILPHANLIIKATEVLAALKTTFKNKRDSIVDTKDENYKLEIKKIDAETKAAVDSELLKMESNYPNYQYLAIIYKDIKEKIEQPGYVEKLTQTMGGNLEKLDNFIQVLKRSNLKPSGFPSDHTPRTIPELLDSVLNKTKEQSSPNNKVFVDHMIALAADKPKSQEFTDRFKKVLVSGMLELMGIQDTNQNYHTILHALEMQMDSHLKMQTILDQNSVYDPNSMWAKLKDSPLSLVTAGLAAFHDIIQNQGQHTNERLSAEAFIKHYNAEFKRDQSPEQIAAMGAVAKDVTIKGTTLNMSFAPGTKHESLLAIENKVLEAFGKSTENFDNSPDEVIKAMSGVLATNDIQRSSSTLALNYVVSEAGKLPQELESALKQTFIAHLQKEPFNFKYDTPENKAKLNAFVDAVLPVFKILIGQNVRMMADGPFRSFGDEASMKGLMGVEDAARVAGTSPEALQTFNEKIAGFITTHGNKIIGKLGNEAGFNENMDNLEIVKMYVAAGNVNMAKILKDQVVHFDEDIFPVLAGKGITNACDVHGKILLPLLAEIFKGVENVKEKNDVMAAVIFCTSNQHGLDELVKRPDLLKQAFANDYGIKLGENLSESSARVVASALVSLQLDPEVKALLGERKTLAAELQNLESKLYIENQINGDPVQIEKLKADIQAINGKIDINKNAIKESAETKIDGQAVSARLSPSDLREIPAVQESVVEFALQGENEPTLSPATSSSGSSSDSEKLEILSWDPADDYLLAPVDKFTSEAIVPLQQSREMNELDSSQNDQVKHSVRSNGGR